MDEEKSVSSDSGEVAGWLKTRLVGDGQLARQGAAVWMNVLTFLPMVVVFFTVWGGFNATAQPADVSVAALKVFAVWCLSFLPGWLYVRFLGQRAGALWTEFTLVLHRLGWDSPGNLPEPPRNSEFHREWADDGGPSHRDSRNIYRLKFDAYYGRSVAEDTDSTNFSVRVDTMFPVFLATALLSACWTATLWDTRFATNPSSVWDVLKYAFIGAYAFVMQSLVRRFFQTDLRPSAYASAVLRIIVVLLTATALQQILNGVDTRTQCAVMFVVGIFPVIALQALTRLAASVLRVAIPQLTPEYPLNQLDGLNLWYESRLLEEGIEDMQNLSTANLIDVILHTRVPVGRLVDWVDQALLYVHLDRTERGWAERRDVKRFAKKVNKTAVADAQTGDDDAEAPTTLEESAIPARGGARVRGSVNQLNRAGTATRIALRQLGIRSATDLLKAFPPDQVDPMVTVTSTQRAAPHAFEEPLPSGVDADQIRILTRVLDEDSSMAAVWNWQSRGVQARNAHRRPRSVRYMPKPRQQLDMERESAVPHAARSQS
jgi:hypothetical protein